MLLATIFIISVSLFLFIMCWIWDKKSHHCIWFNNSATVFHLALQQRTCLYMIWCLYIMILVLYLCESGPVLWLNTLLKRLCVIWTPYLDPNTHTWALNWAACVWEVCWFKCILGNVALFSKSSAGVITNTEQRTLACFRASDVSFMQNPHLRTS